MKMKWFFGVAAAAPLALVACASEPAPAPPATLPAGDFGTLTGADAHGFKMPADMVQVTTFGSAAHGFSYERYQQMFGPAQVAGAQITIERGQTGAVDVVGGRHVDAIVPSNSVVLSNADAIAIVAAVMPEATERAAALMIEPGDGRYYYAVDSRGEALRYSHYVDAETGAIFNQFSTLTSGCTYSPGGVGFLSPTDQIDLTGKVTSGALAFGKQTTRDLGSQKKPFYGTADKDADGCWDKAGRTSPGQGALVSAHVNVAAADAYYQSTYGFDLASKITGTYANTLTVWAHYSVNYNNAYWDGAKMVFGDGDGVTYREFTANDVAAHEISHGITEFTSNLTYSGESGALNESFSDIMGYTIGDPTDWRMGEDVTTNGNGFRDMLTPSTFNDPDTYCQRYTGTNDNGGVHSNSGISNRAFALTVSATQTTQTGVDADGNPVMTTSPVFPAGKASDIFFRAYTGLPSNATFADARAKTIAEATAQDPDGTLGYAAAVTSAWDTVKVSAAGGPDLCASAPPPPPQCTVNTDCPDDADPCTVPTCTSGTCGFSASTDPSCTTTPTCGASNASCSSNADCCSNSCRLSGKKAHTCT